MAIQPFPDQRPGDYVVTRGHDTPEERTDAERTLRAQGCRTFRHESTANGQLRSHGYLA